MTYHRTVETLNITTSATPTVTSVESDVITAGPEKNPNSAFLWEYVTNPGVATVGLLVLQAKLLPTAPFSEVFEYVGGARIELDLATTVAPSRNIMGAGIQIFHQQKWVTEGLVTVNAVAVLGWHIE